MASNYEYFDPYEIYNQRRLYRSAYGGYKDPGTYDPSEVPGRPRREPNYPQGVPPKPGGKTGDNRPQGNIHSGGGGGRATSVTEAIGPPPPQPSAADVQAKKDGTATPEQEERVRNWRQYAAREQEEMKQEIRHGIIPRRADGSIPGTALNLLAYGGDLGLAPKLDILGRRIWSTNEDPNNPGQMGYWRDFTAGELGSLGRLQQWRDNPQNEALNTSMLGAGGGLLRHNSLAQNHFVWDPSVNAYKKSWGNGIFTYLNAGGNPISAPDGAQGNGIKGGLQPNHYELNDQPGSVYPTPTFESAYGTPPPTQYKMNSDSGSQPLTISTTPITTPPSTTFTPNKKRVRTKADSGYGAFGTF